MKEFKYTITDPLGMHARPAGLFVKEVSSYSSTITISKDKDGETVDAKRIFAVMKLAIKSGDIVTIHIEGPDEELAYENLQSFMKNTL